jgi:deoxycytidylate deaminase
MMQLALRLTRRSTHRRHALACVVVRGGAVLSSAANGSREGQCAERLALRPKRVLDGAYAGAVLYVARSNGLCSKPCEECQAAIVRAGIRKVYYVNRIGKVDEWRVS